MLKKRALKLKIKKGWWWKIEEDGKGSSGKAKKKRSDAVNAVEVSAADARYDQVMNMMAKVLQGQKESEEKICAMTEKQEVEGKEKEELLWEARVKEQEAEIARLKAQAAGGRRSCERQHGTRRRPGPRWSGLRAEWGLPAYGADARVTGLHRV